MEIEGHSIDIRPWREEDRGMLIDMLIDCLRINFEAGAEMLPTQKNAAVLFELGLQASKRGEACFVADLLGQLIGFTLWVDLPNPLSLDYNSKVLYGLGTYVIESVRKMGVSKALRDVAESRGAELGFDKVMGQTYHEVGLKSVMNRGFQVAGFMVEKQLR